MYASAECKPRCTIEMLKSRANFRKIRTMKLQIEEQHSDRLQSCRSHMFVAYLT